MNRIRIVIMLVFLVFITILPGTAQSVRVCTYNILNFPQAMGTQRIDELRDIIEYIDPDILIVQEMQSQAGVDMFLDSIMNYYTPAYRAAPFHDGPDTDNSLFYKQDEVTLIGQYVIPTVTRDIMRYTVWFNEAEKELEIFSLHLKASQGPENEAIRLQEAMILREYLDSLPQDINALVMGDYNLYTSEEPAYGELLRNGSSGALYDPLDIPGAWHENSDFAHVHTQSTRVNPLPDGGATGGLDDRFDIVLCTSNLLDSADLYLPAQNYTVFGNDGEHFNTRVNSGYNQSVPGYIADALYYASDHLPVSVDIVHGFQAQQETGVVKIYPNPVQQRATVQWPWHDDFQSADITITNILGQRVYAHIHVSQQAIALDRGTLPVGIYFMQVTVHTQFQTYIYHTKMAVVE